MITLEECSEELSKYFTSLAKICNINNFTFESCVSKHYFSYFSLSENNKWFLSILLCNETPIICTHATTI